MATTIAANAGTLRYRAATRAGFFITGFGAAAWAPLVPFAKARVGIDNGLLGLVLLATAAGAMLTMPLAGALAGRLGCRTVVLGAGALLCLCLPPLAFVTSLPILIATLFAFGAAMGTLDVTINIQSIIVERDAGLPLLSGFHGFYSLGGIAGAAGMTALFALGATPLVATLAVAGVCVAALAAAAPGLLRDGAGRGGPAFAFPRGAIWFLGSLAFILFLVEGSVQDWSAVFLSTVRAMPRAEAGLGFACFATTMTIGRLTGDRIVHRFGGANVVVLGGLCAAAGFALATFVGGWPAGLVGYALVGAGCSNAVPVLYSAVGRQTDMPESLAVPALSSMGYAGILVGPALIGGIAHVASLPAAFALLALLLVGVAASGRLLKT
ncbi:MAG TPA: MFS transporter [Caulobacteraceae bacterium]|nr:MFS transporter [Caulobacteraceae bacterium]